MRTRSTKLTLATSLAVVVTAIVAGVATAGSSDPGQPAPTTPSDSAVFAGGGTVSVPGVVYPKGTAAPGVGTPQSGPSPEEAQKVTVSSSSIGTADPGRRTHPPSVRRWCPQQYGGLASCILRMKAHVGR